MSGGEGGSWDGQDKLLGSEFYELVAQRPLVAFKVLALARIVELGGLPLIKITLINGDVIECDFNGILLERGSFKIDIYTTNDLSLKIEALLIKEIFIIDQDSGHITEQSIVQSLELDNKIAKYFYERKVAGGGIG